MANRHNCQVLESLQKFLLFLLFKIMSVFSKKQVMTQLILVLGRSFRRSVSVWYLLLCDLYQSIILHLINMICAYSSYGAGSSYYDWNATYFVESPALCLLSMSVLPVIEFNVFFTRYVCHNEFNAYLCFTFTI